MKKQNLVIVISFLALLILSSACTTQPTPTYITGEEKDRAAELSAPYAENILKGIEKNDYQVFVMNFDNQMLEAMTEAQFANIVKMYGPLGAAQSWDLINIEDREPYYGVNYKVTYPDKVVIMLVVVNKVEPNLVSGLWFK
jgi:hypothetical protein